MRNRITLGIFSQKDFFQHRVKAITIGDAATRHIDKRDRDVILDHISKATLETDYFSLKIFVEVVGKQFNMHKVDREVIENFMFWLKNEKQNQYGKNYSDGAIRTYLKHLSAFFSWAKEQEFVDDNPIFGIKKPGKKTMKNPHLRLMDDGQIQNLRTYFDKKPEWQLDIFNFSMWTSARRAEALAFRKDDFIKLQVHGERKYFVRLMGKGSKVRIVPIGNACVLDIERRLEYLKDEKEFYRLIEKQVTPDMKRTYHLRWKEGFLFFDVADGKSVSKAFMRARRACGIPETVTFHSARHTYATHLLAEGVDIKVVSELLGHSDLKSTEIYANVLNSTIMNQTKNVTEL